jgi:hypothetical protein
MKIFTTLVTVLLFTTCSAQLTVGDQLNQEKYWKYRDHLRKRFMRIGIGEGESIPASVIIPNRRYGQADQTTGSIIQWRDATITIGYYWIVLASEYKLLVESGQGVQPTLNELYYAMKAFNRLDMTAEDYLAGNLQANPDPEDLNGFFIRDDVRHEITNNFENDPPIPNGPIQPDPGNPNQMRSDFEGWINYDSGGMGDEVQTTEPQLGSSESLDHLTTILLGLDFIQRFIPDETIVQPTIDDLPMNIRQEALDMIQRIVNYLNDTEPNFLGNYSYKEWTIFSDEDEIVHNKGYNCLIASYPITEFVKSLFDSQYSEMIGEPGKVRLQFRSDEMCLFEPEPGWGEDLNAFITDSLGINVTFDLDTDQALAAILNVWLTTIGTTLLANFINPALMPLFTLQGAVWATANCLGNVPCCEAVDGPIIIDVPNNTIKLIWEAMEDNNVPLNANGSVAASGQGETYIVTDGMSIFVDFLPTDLPPIIPFKLSKKFTDDDNVRIMHELAILGNIWGPNYISSNSYQSALVHLPMMQDVLHEGGIRVSTTNSKAYYAELLDLAPCIGPWADPYNFLNVAQEWASANRLFHPGDRNTGAFKANNLPGGGSIINPDPEYRGYFPGIDYMVIYNLYHMLWNDELPAYQRTTSCECIQEITYEVELETILNVEPKFNTYRRMGIPIESYLAHSTEINSTSGILNIKNDLIICRENTEVQTVLSITDGAALNLLGGNTIEVREGNMIVLNNATLTGAIIDPTDPTYTESTIHFKAGAEFHILNGSELILGGGLTIIMDEGSKLIIDASDVTALESLYSNHFIIHGEETVVQLHNNSHYQSSAPVHWEFTDHASLSIRNSLVQSNQDQWSFHNQCSVSISHNSQCYFVNSTQDMTANGTWFIDNSYFDISASELNINTGSELHTNSTSFIIRNGGQVSIKNVFPNQQASHYYFDESTDLQIKGSDSKLVFHGGKLHIPDNQIFTFTYPNAESGFIEVLAGTENMLHTGNNSVFLLVGEGSEDLMLRIAPGAHI